jgi:hypothetical protein
MQMETQLNLNFRITKIATVHAYSFRKEEAL